MRSVNFDFYGQHHILILVCFFSSVCVYVRVCGGFSPYTIKYIYKRRLKGVRADRVDKCGVFIVIQIPTLTLRARAYSFQWPVCIY